MPTKRPTKSSSPASRSNKSFATVRASRINRKTAIIAAAFVAIVGIAVVAFSGASTKDNPYFAACTKENPNGLPQLQLGSTGDCVRAAQWDLQYFGVQVTGTYDQKTSDTVRFFQVQTGATGTGKTDAATWAALFGNPFVTKCKVPYPTITATQNNHGDCVSMLQWFFVDSGWPKVAINGTYDAVTQNAVQFYKANVKLSNDSVVDTATWIALFDYRRTPFAPANSPAPTPVPQPTTVATTRPTLSYGATGSYVSDVQSRLCIPADGVFGPQTRGAVVEFQQRNGLGADGIVGPQTWAKLLAVGRQCQPNIPVATTNGGGSSQSNYGGSSNNTGGGEGGAPNGPGITNAGPPSHVNSKPPSNPANSGIFSGFGSLINDINDAARGIGQRATGLTQQAGGLIRKIFAL